MGANACNNAGAVRSGNRSRDPHDQSPESLLGWRKAEMVVSRVGTMTVCRALAKSRHRQRTFGAFLCPDSRHDTRSQAVAGCRHVRKDRTTGRPVQQGRSKPSQWTTWGWCRPAKDGTRCGQYPVAGKLGIAQNSYGCPKGCQETTIVQMKGANK